MGHWHEEGSDITRIVDDAIAWHATLAHNKSHSVPGEYLPEIERLVMKLGFRLVLREIDHDPTIMPAASSTIKLDWENLGIAPPYRDHRVAFRLRDHRDSLRAVHVSDQSIRGWLPGPISLTVEYPLPAELDQGAYTLELGLVFHSAADRIVPLANEGKTDDGWYAVGTMVVKK
jgi:hypothetical protein